MTEPTRWMPQKEADAWKEITKDRREEFIKKAKEADWGFVALVETMMQDPNFEDYPEEQKQFVKDFIEARKQP